MPSIISIIFLLALSSGSAFARTYHKAKDYTAHGPNGFFDQFDFFSKPDPTHGRVDYVDRWNANASRLIHPGSTSGIYIGVDHENVVPGNRKSIRIHSKETYGPGMLLVADIRHAPTGCATWPALWMLGMPEESWPQAGEIDIMEQVNLADTNQMVLHTSPGCALTSRLIGAGNMVSQDCNSQDGHNGNQGCAIQAPGHLPSFGERFNNNGGGVYVTEWKKHGGFKIWFFSHAGSIPRTLKTDHPDTKKLGKPIAVFRGNGCNWDQHFRDMKIIINTSLCGDFAGGLWHSSGCAARYGNSCEEFVSTNPQAFREAYWKIKGLRVYKS